MKNQIRAFLLALVLVPVAFMFAACGGSSDEASKIGYTSGANLYYKVEASSGEGATTYTSLGVNSSKYIKVDGGSEDENKTLLYHNSDPYTMIGYSWVLLGGYSTADFSIPGFSIQLTEALVKSGHFADNQTAKAALKSLKTSNIATVLGYTCVEYKVNTASGYELYFASKDGVLLKKVKCDIYAETIQSYVVTALDLKPSFAKYLIAMPNLVR